MTTVDEPLVAPLPAATRVGGARPALRLRELALVTAGGIALAIASELDLPVKLIGVGEGLEDLRPFDAREFATALIGE